MGINILDRIMQINEISRGSICLLSRKIVISNHYLQMVSGMSFISMENWIWGNTSQLSTNGLCSPRKLRTFVNLSL